MQIAPPLRHSISQLAVRMDRVAAGLADGAFVLRETTLDGEGWRAEFDGALREVGAAWRAPWQEMALAQAQAGRLRVHPASTAASELVNGAVQQAKSGFDQIARGMMRLPANLTRDEGVRVLQAILRIADWMVAGASDAHLGLVELARPRA